MRAPAQPVPTQPRVPHFSAAKRPSPSATAGRLARKQFPALHSFHTAARPTGRAHPPARVVQRTTAPSRAFAVEGSPLRDQMPSGANPPAVARSGAGPEFPMGPAARPVAPKPAGWPAFLALAAQRWNLHGVVPMPLPPWQNDLALPGADGRDRRPGKGAASRAGVVLRTDSAEQADQVARGLSKASVLDGRAFIRTAVLFLSVPSSSSPSKRRPVIATASLISARATMRPTCSRSPPSTGHQAREVADLFGLVLIVAPWR